MTEPNASTIRQATKLFHRMRHSLIDRGLCQETKHGLREVQWTGWMPWFDRRAFAFIMDTTNLPVALEKLTDPNVIHQVSTALDGRPVQITNHRGVLWAVGMDLPPADPPQRSLPKRVELNLTERPQGEYVLGLGASTDGPVWVDLVTACHMMIGGSSRSGKSATLRSLLFQLMLMPEPVEVVLSDMEGRTFSAFEGMPRVRFPVAEDLESATRLTAWLMEEMDRRKAILDANPYHPENLVEHHEAIREQHRGELPDELRLPWLVAVFDEFTALLDQAGQRSPFYHHIGQLAMRSAKYGITLIYAGQDFKSDLINSRITNQVRTRVAHQCANRWQSESIVHVAGAERIAIQGRALVELDKKHLAVQCYWVPKPWVLYLRRRSQHVAMLSDAASMLPPAPLTELQRRMVEYAIRELGGAFNIKALFDQFKDEITRRELIQIGQAWEQKGWLTPQPSPNTARQITGELRQVRSAFQRVPPVAETRNAERAERAERSGTRAEPWPV